MSEGKHSARDRRAHRDRGRRLKTLPQTLPRAIPGGAETPRSKGSGGSDIPRHVCIIADGNASWARMVEDRALYDRALARFADAVDRIVECGSACVTISMFSKIDWLRAREHLDRLMDLVGDSIGYLTARSRDGGYRMKRIGTLDRLPERYDRVAEAFAAAEAETSAASRATLVVPFDYSGREEICRAFVRMNAAGITAEAVDEASIRTHLDEKDVPDPDIVIRVGGGLRLSDVYTFQSDYSTLFFLENVTPPDLTLGIVDRILQEHARGYYYSQGRPSEFIARAG